MIRLYILLVLITTLVHAPPIRDEGMKDVWIIRLFLNLLGYATLIVPAALLIRYLKRIKYQETGSGFCFPVVKLCVFGHDADSKVSEQAPASSAVKREGSTFVMGVKLVACTIGLQVAYLTWGVLQERIMTIEYGKTDASPGEKFKNSQFLVFVNRFQISTDYFSYTVNKHRSSK